MLDSGILTLVEETLLVDTHEHLLEESTRITGTSDRPGVALRDFAVLLSHYADSDLLTAGMSLEDHDRLFSVGVEPGEKWRIVAPWYGRTRTTGYLMAVRESLRRLFGQSDLQAENVEEISAAIDGMIGPGYYRAVIRDHSGVDYCQVNSLETELFMETEYPDLLAQDLSIVALSTSLDHIEKIGRIAGIEVHTLRDWHGVLDWAFATYGPRAIAVKSQAAYQRGLDYTMVGPEEADPLFQRYLASRGSLSPSETKALQDHLFCACLERAQAYELPVKLHTGYYAGTGRMPLHRLRRNAGDLTDLMVRYPEVRFVVMHMTYPYQDEAIAMAKHYPGAYVDMCWAWIINPAAGVRFLKEALMAIPANKILVFGGDYMPVEVIPGHAAVARRGIACALSELVEDGWLASADIPGLVADLMHGNADALFDRDRALSPG